MSNNTDSNSPRVQLVRWAIYLLLAVGIVAAMWIATAIVGTVEVVDHCTAIVESQYPASQRLLRSPKEEPERGWHFVGDASSPLPLIVSTRVEGGSGGLGVGERHYFLWFFGRIVRLPYHRLEWNSG